MKLKSSQHKHILNRALIVALFTSFLTAIPAHADYVLNVAEDFNTGYSRTLFKLWVDEDRNGCDTRAEVLISEALVKPKVGKGCSLTGGTWLSPYDNKVQSNASSLDIDHLVPLAEAWRSGAWKWTSAQRQAYANDLRNKEVLIAVTASLNRSKGDKDVANWLPPYGQCTYVRDWVVVKLTYGLTVDSIEATKLQELIRTCGISGVTIALTSPSSPTPSSNSLATNPPSPSASAIAVKQMPAIPKPTIEAQSSSSVTLYIPEIPNWDFSLMKLTFEWLRLPAGNCSQTYEIKSLPFRITCEGVATNSLYSGWLIGKGDYGKVTPTQAFSESVLVDTYKLSTQTSITNPSTPSSNSVTKNPTPTPTISSPTLTTPSPSPSPTFTQTSSITWPQDSSARCKDGTFSFSKTRSGTCSGHGGVDTWRNP